VMVSVRASEADVLPLLEGHDGVGVAAVNGPASVVISGAEAEVAVVVEHLEQRGVKTRKLRVSHAFHSPLMEPMLAEFRQVVEGLSYEAPRIPLVSNVTGELVGDEVCEPEYWVRHVREAVRFADGVTRLAALGVTACLELGPDGVLSSMGQDSAQELLFSPVLRKDRDESDSLLEALAQVYVQGHVVDWAAFLAPSRPRRVELPTYAFQRERYWMGSPPEADEDIPETVDSGFWDAVERGDASELADLLALSGDESLTAVLPALSAWRRRDRERSAVEGWRYRVAWSPLVDVSGVLSGVWLVVVPAGRA
ncbi:acyltransferase domain-containing protein, partial [Streptomyces cucumeris]|uniref:acyltransferase domain-containing protein n=1 Tax=Streptomyces cucumeris TaxID=2962890 RepID=UPI003D72EB17